MSPTNAVAIVDVRTLPPAERHPLVFSTFHGLATGQAMELVNDHDPRPLHARFMTDLASAFAWDRIEEGPDTWRVRITKLESPAAGGRCCGGCGGG